MLMLMKMTKVSMGGLPPVDDPDAQALIARMATPPSGARQSKINQYIKGLKSAGIWAKLDVFYVLAAHDAQAAKLNWTGNFNNLTEVNSPTFTTDRGYTGNGTSSYLDSGRNLATAGGNFTQNSASMFAWPLTNVANNGTDIGSGGNNRVFTSRSATNRFIVRGNSSGADDIATTTSVGLKGYSRSSSSSVDLWSEGTITTRATASSTVDSGNLAILVTGTLYSSRQVSMGGVGSYLNSTEEAALRSLHTSWLQHVGAI